MDKTQVLIKGLHRENLCTYYILPLIKLSKYNFAGEGNFCDSFLANDMQSIFVEVRNLFICKHRVKVHPQFLGSFTSNSDRLYIQFRLPDEWKVDMDLFLKGLYSKLSDRAKDMVKQYSGLQYRFRTEDGTIVTDIRLLAFDKSKVVREIWEEHLNQVLPPDAELLGIPTEKTFMADFPLRRM